MTGPFPGLRSAPNTPLSSLNSLSSLEKQVPRLACCTAQGTVTRDIARATGKWWGWAGTWALDRKVRKLTQTTQLSANPQPALHQLPNSLSQHVTWTHSSEFQAQRDKRPVQETPAVLESLSPALSCPDTSLAISSTFLWPITKSGDVPD